MTDPKPELTRAWRHAPQSGDPRTDAVFRSHLDAPLQRFEALLALAQENDRSATAMTLATVDADGLPTTRIVLLKEVSQGGLVFYTNGRSRKARALQARPAASALFWWASLEVQVRFDGEVRPVSAAEADAYWVTRPRGSQLGAWASDQSAELASRDELEARLAEVTRLYEGRDVPRPPHWGGFRITPREIEFWKNRESRLHDRELYRRVGAAWERTLLNP